MSMLSILRRHWLPILLVGFLVMNAVQLHAIDKDRDKHRALAEQRGKILDGAVDAVGAANGWPSTVRLKVEQLPAQIQLYGNFIRDTRAASQRAKAEDLSHARAIETRDLEIMKETQDALTKKLANELRRADDYALRLRAATDRATTGRSGGSGESDVPATADASGTLARTSPAPFMDESDIRICTTNTVKTEGWREFWAEVFATPR